MHLARKDGRAPAQARPVKITPGFVKYAEGSALIEVGDTHVICAASVGTNVPPWLRGRGSGWVTAEYSMLPRATQDRTPREGRDRSLGGRTQEIQRLVGRSLRAVTDLKAMGEMTVTVDCDVLRADGGTRCAAITGGYVALALAFRRLVAGGTLSAVPLRTPVAAISAGIVDGEGLLDLAYDEDSRASADFNIVMTGEMEFVEVQGTAEGAPFSRERLDRLLLLAGSGVADLIAVQGAAINAAG